MRTDRTVVAISLSLLLAACGKQDQPTAGLPDDLSKDLAAASESATALVTAPQSYKRMRFVSDIEQSRATERAAKPKSAHDMHHMVSSSQPASETTNESATDAVATMAAAAPSPVPTSEQPAPEQSVVVAARPAPEAPSARGGPSSDGDVLDHAGSGGIGGILAGIAGAAVLRGGPASVRKCDPRSDGYGGRARPDLMMPSPVRQVFGGSRR